MQRAGRNVATSQRRDVGSTKIEVNKQQRRDVSTSRRLNVATSQRRGVSDELKSHPFSVIFSDLFLSKKTDLCAEIWNNSPNCYAAGNLRERGIFAVERAEGG